MSDGKNVQVNGEIIARWAADDDGHQIAILDLNDGVKRDVSERYVLIQNGGGDWKYTNTPIPPLGAIVSVEGKLNWSGGPLPVIHPLTAMQEGYAGSGVPDDRPLSFQEQFQAHEFSDLVPDWLNSRLSLKIRLRRKEGYVLRSLERMPDQEMAPGRVMLTWELRPD